MVRTYLSGALGFIFFGAGSFFLIALKLLFPITLASPLDIPFQLFLFIFGLTPELSVLAEIILPFWTVTWILLIAIGCIDIIEQTKTAYLTIILGIISAAFVLISSIAPALFFQGFQDSFKTLFLLGVLLSENPILSGGLWDGFFIASAFTPLLSGYGFARSLYMLLEMVSNYTIATYLLTVAIAFFNVDNKGYGSSYKIFTGILVVVYASIKITLGILTFMPIGLVIMALGAMEVILFYLLPIFGVMLFVLIHLDNPE